MRYATWKFALNSDKEKTTPPMVEGIAFLDKEESLIFGYLDESADISQMSKWFVNEITQIEAFNLISANIENVTIDSDGMFIFPLLNLIEV